MAAIHSDSGISEGPSKSNFEGDLGRKRNWCDKKSSRQSSQSTLNDEDTSGSNDYDDPRSDDFILSKSHSNGRPERPKSISTSAKHTHKSGSKRKSAPESNLKDVSRKKIRLDHSPKGNEYHPLRSVLSIVRISQLLLTRGYTVDARRSWRT